MKVLSAIQLIVVIYTSRSNDVGHGEHVKINIS